MVWWQLDMAERCARVLAATDGNADGIGIRERGRDGCMSGCATNETGGWANEVY